MFRGEKLKLGAVEKIKDMLKVMQTFLMKHDNKFLAGPNITLPGNPFVFLSILFLSNTYNKFDYKLLS